MHDAIAILLEKGYGLRRGNGLYNSDQGILSKNFSPEIISCMAVLGRGSDPCTNMHDDAIAMRNLWRRMSDLKLV